MIFKNLIEKWKEEWYIRECSNLAKEYKTRLDDAKIQLEDEIIRVEESWTNKLESLNKKIKFEEEEAEYKLKVVEERKLELIRLDNELKNQIKILEAKASPSNVWSEAFSLGMSKCWDLMLPIMSENIDKLKSKIKEDAALEAIQRLKNAPNKK